MNKKVLALLSLGHAATDINQGALPMILTFLQPVLGLSQLQIGAVMLAFNVSSSVIQPAFGILSDRFTAAYLIPIGCLLAGLGMAFTGYAPNYPLLLAIALVSGLGVAAYHPEGSKFSRFASGARKASGMSLFSVGGNFGFAAGPALATLFIGVAGLPGSLGFLVLNGLMAVVLWSYLRVITSPAPETEAAQSSVGVGAGAEPGAGSGPGPELQPEPEPGPQPDTGQPGKLEVLKPGAQRLEAISSGQGSRTVEKAAGRVVAPVILLVLVIIMRTWVHLGMVTFLPQYYVHYLHHSETYAAIISSLFLLAGAFGTLAGGPAADRWGLKTIIVSSMAAMVPILFFFTQAQGFWIPVVVIMAGFTLVSTFSVTVVLGQELLPHNVGLASGLTLGFAIGTGGIGATLLGWIGDHWGLPAIFHTMIIFPAIGLLLALFLPGREEMSQRRAAAAAPGS